MKILLSILYGGAVRLRTGLYRRGLLSRRHLPNPVLSVGNLTAGGTGKTPFVELLARILHEAGLHPAILSRGYRGSAEKTNLLVSDGRRLLATPGQAGDEPFLLARRLQGIPVMVGRNRYRSGCRLAEELKPEVFILDDGYQHLQLERQLNILLVDATDPFGGGRLLPAGRLREPLSALERADWIVVTRADFPLDQEEIETTIRQYNRRTPIWYFHHDATGLVQIDGGARLELRAFFRKPILALAGIGNPGVFLRDLNHHQIRVLDQVLVHDHHPYSQGELDDILKRMMKIGAEAIVTTEKDAVRLGGLHFPKDSLFALQIEARAENPEDFRRALLEEVRELCGPGQATSRN